MTVKNALAYGKNLLETAGIDTPYLDSVVLLAFAAGKTKEKLLTDLPEEVEEDVQRRYEEYLRMREEGIPVSYIRGKKEFYDLEFHVDRRVLIPRPDTETLIDAVRAVLGEDSSILRVHDSCTGSGCIPVTLKHLYPSLEISASDISSDALDVFLLNCEKILGFPLLCYQSDLLQEVAGVFDVITANPPYLTTSETGEMMSRKWPEPPSALDGGSDGLDVVRRLVLQGTEKLRDGGYLFLEAAQNQAPEIADIFLKNRYTRVFVHKDLAGRDRVISGQKGA